MFFYDALPYFFVFCMQFLVMSWFHWALHWPIIKERVKEQKVYLWGLMVVVLAHVVFSALLQKEVGDVMLFAGAGWHLRHQIDFYFIDANHTQYPFFPFLIFIHAGLNWIQELWPMLTFSFYLKLVLLIAAIGISVLIKRVEKNEQEGKVAQLRFLTHPLLTLAVFFHGQVDVVLLAFFVWAVHWLMESKKEKSFWLGIVAYALSVAAKTWSIIFLPWILLTLKNWWKRVLLILCLGVTLIGITFVYTRLVDGSSIRSVLPAVLRPGGPVGEWGVSFALRPWAAALQKANLLIFAAGMATVYLLILWKKPVGWLAYLLIVLGVYVVIPNFGIQYLFWVVPLLYLAKLHQTKQMIFYTVAGGFYAFLSYINIATTAESIPFSLVRSVGLVLWLFFGWWFWQLLTTQLKK